MAAGVWGAPAMAQQVHGVTDTEILIGTVTDLSGVTAIQGVNNANAIRMLFDEENAKGGDQLLQDPVYRSRTASSTVCHARFRP